MHCPYPVGFAHRLGGALAPENTLAGLLLAHQLGVRAVECDVQLTANGVAVIAHDEMLARTTSGSGVLSQHTAAELAALDAGSHHHPAFSGERLPTLQRLAAISRQLEMAVNLELKPFAGDREMGGEVARQIGQHWQGASLLPLVSSFSVAALAGVRQQAPALPLALLVDDISAEVIAQAQSLHCCALHVAYRALTAAWVAQLHARGLAVMAWTVNRPEDMLLLRHWGVDMLCSDRPDLLAVLALA